MNKVFFYLWCMMAVFGLVASFYNPGHIWFSFIPSVIMACAYYPDIKTKKETRP